MMLSLSPFLSLLLLLNGISVGRLPTTEAFIASSTLHHRRLSPSLLSPPRSLLFLAALVKNSPDDEEFIYESSFVAAAAAAAGNDVRNDSNSNSYQNKDDDDDDDEEAENSSARTELKRQLLTVAASYDRGFSSTPAVRQSVEDIIQQLAVTNPNKDNASQGMNGNSDNDDSGVVVPLKGIWRLIWTTAYDVVSLGALPIVAPSAIYQDIRSPPAIINIIDFIPRIILLGPTSLLRAKVTTRASIRDANRVGLTFEGVVLQPMELLGQKVDTLLPPILTLDFTLPQTIIRQLISLVPGLNTNDDRSNSNEGKDTFATNNNDESTGYFDVEYVDDELLIIRQQVPGGVFVLVKVDNCDP